MSGARASVLQAESRRIIVFDDDHYYIGGVLAELLAAFGHSVTFVTPEAHVSSWTVNTLERERIQVRVRRAGIRVETNRVVLRAAGGEVVTACVYTGEETVESVDAVVLVTARLPVDNLYRSLLAEEQALAAVGINSVISAGDAWAPATIAAAVWSGRRYAESFDHSSDKAGEYIYRREYVALEGEPTTSVR